MQTAELPMLYGMSRLDKVKQWQAKAEENDNGTATIIIESGYVGGKIQSKPKLIRKGKNIGKSNETTPFEQAMSQIESSWNGKRYENYEPHMLDPDTYIPRLMLPQLAKGMGKGKIVYPCYIQPKLNGVCNLAELYRSNFRDYRILHHSRGGHTFETLNHLNKWLDELNAPAPPHGELYVHGWSLQTIGGYTKKIRPDQHKLEYWLYDIAWIGPIYQERIEWLRSNIPTQIAQPDCPIKFTPTSIVNNYDEAKAYHDDYVQQGFEGGMLKNIKGIYMFQYNSNDLEKLKAYEDSEFEIVGGKEGTGTDEGCIIYRCRVESGLEFDARPRGTVENRKEMFINLPNDIGKMLTVRYAELSDDGIPLQPVGVPAEAEAVRDYE
jgi:DNA ligase-1